MLLLAEMLNPGGWHGKVDVELPSRLLDRDVAYEPVHSAINAYLGRLRTPCS